MALDATNVRVAVTGAVYAAPEGSTSPTNATTAPAAAFLDLGYLGEDGLTLARDVDSDEIVTWQNGTVVRRTITSQATTIEFKLVETKEDVLEFVNPGATITGAGPYAMEVGPVTSERHAIVFDVVDDTIRRRLYFPNCEITDFGDVEFVNGQAIGYPVTLTCYPDASDVVWYEFSDDTAWA
jgi:hypothetical protein